MRISARHTHGEHAVSDDLIRALWRHAAYGDDGSARTPEVVINHYTRLLDLSSPREWSGTNTAFAAVHAALPRIRIGP